MEEKKSLAEGIFFLRKKRDFYIKTYLSSADEDMTLSEMA